MNMRVLILALPLFLLLGLRAPVAETSGTSDDTTTLARAFASQEQSKFPKNTQLNTVLRQKNMSEVTFKSFAERVNTVSNTGDIKMTSTPQRDMQQDIVDDIRKSALELGNGGPFGAVVYKNGILVAKGVNSVLVQHDPTAHAEIVAIRNACQVLGTHDLSGCELYATGYPCPMCMSAIIWANIRKVYYSCDYQDAERLGFRDAHISRFLQGNCQDAGLLQLQPVDKSAILKIYDEYLQKHGTIY